jgi:ectoine hydroxylase-related dioxygenase (phytanoyl-CoA dioxygenase family)
VATLDQRKQLISDLWLDQPDAHEQIDRRLSARTLAAADAARLHHFTDNGYLTAPLGFGAEVGDRMEADIEELWRIRPYDLAAAPSAGGRISFRDFPDDRRKVGYRIADLHSHSATALDLYLHPEIFRLVELILGQTAVAFQSLYFRYGSEQSLHRDPMFVVTRPASHLVAAWIALEDITDGSGPLLYAPGSHRSPWHEFEEDKITLSDKGGGPKRQEWSEARARMLEHLEVQRFTPSAGEVLIWHGGLLHGGAKVTDPQSTRRSYVVHYSSAANYTRRRASMQAAVGRRWRRSRELKGVSAATERMLERDGHRGLDNPLRELTRS